MRTFKQFQRENTGVDLEKYVDIRLSDFDKLLEVITDASERAIDLAKESMSTRLEGWPDRLNELKSEIDQVSGSVVTEKMLNEKIDSLRENMSDKIEMQKNVAVGALVTALLSLAGLIISHLLAGK